MEFYEFCSVMLSVMSGCGPTHLSHLSCPPALACPIHGTCHRLYRITLHGVRKHTRRPVVGAAPDIDRHAMLASELIA